MSRTIFKTMALLALGLSALVSAPQQAHAQTAQAAQKPVLTTLHRFDGKYGAPPQFDLMLGSDGNFYGLTFYGGLGNNGTVFQMTPAGKFTTLWRFNGTNGANPTGKLVEGPDGALYGMTQLGGKYKRGTAFRITQDGHLTTLHAFSGYAGDGGYPAGGLLLAPDGTFYGILSVANVRQQLPSGELFQMTSTGNVSLLYNVGESTSPNGALISDADGAIYGTASGGFGFVYRRAVSRGQLVLHTFNGNDGDEPLTGLTAGPDGVLYGVTYSGGIGYTGIFGTGNGVAYKVTPSGVFTLLHKFSEDGHGTHPFSALTLGKDGNFYGTTVSGGIRDGGTVFQMTPQGQVTTLYKFHTVFDGVNPYGSVTFGPDNALYGMDGGGKKGYGTIYKLTLP